MSGRSRVSARPAGGSENQSERARPEPAARPPPPPPPLPSRPAPARSPPSSRLSPESPSEAPFGSRRRPEQVCARASPSLLLAPASRAPASLPPARALPHLRQDSARHPARPGKPLATLLAVTATVEVPPTLSPATVPSQPRNH